MGSTAARRKHKRANRRPRSSNSYHGNDLDAEMCSNHQVGDEEVDRNHDSRTEQELEDVLLMNLKFFYTVALSTFCQLGYEESFVLKAILNNGHSCGKKDILSNILHNTSRYLITGKTDEFVFVNLKQLLYHSLAAMLSTLQKSKPHMTKRDAMIHLSINVFNLSPSVKEMMLRIAADFSAGFRAHSEKLQTQGNDASLSSGNSSPDFKSGFEPLVDQNEQLQDAQSEDVVGSTLDREEDEITDFLEQVKDLERQVKERKAWAQQKAMQAETKLCDHQRELDMLRKERKRKLDVQDSPRIRSMVRKLLDVEDAHKKAIDQLRGTKAALKQCQFENAKIRAELKASELTTSESVRTCVQVAKREKNCMKRLSALEKQNSKLHDDIAAVKQQNLQLETQLVQVEAAQEEAQAKWKEAQKAKESALVQLEEERCLLKTTEVTNKRELEALRLNIEIDFQRHKDDVQRLELELSQLKVSSQASHLNLQSNNLPMANTEGLETERDIIATMFDNKSDNQAEYCSNRKCFICEKGEVSVVFLPCAHQVLCFNCSDRYEEKIDVCPCCSVPIKEKIRVFGADSS